MAKILIVEDEAIIVHSFKIELEAQGNEICGMVSTAKEAIEFVQENEPDLILMDINLSGDMDGIQAAEKILEMKSIPIVFMTGYTHKRNAERVKKIDHLAYISKPIDPYQILKLIEKL